MSKRTFYATGSFFFGSASSILGTVISSPEIGLIMAFVFIAGMAWGSLFYTAGVSK